MPGITKIPVIYVDDDHNNLEAFALIAPDHWELHLFDNGLDLLKKIDDLQPWIVLSDIIMPTLNGGDLLRIIKKFEKPPRVLFVTGYSPENIQTSIDKTNNVEIIKKPWDPEALIARIETLIDEYRREDSLKIGAGYLSEHGESLTRCLISLTKGEANQENISELQKHLTKSPSITKELFVAALCKEVNHYIRDLLESEKNVTQDKVLESAHFFACKWHQKQKTLREWLDRRTPFERRTEPKSIDFDNRRSGTERRQIFPTLDHKNYSIALIVRHEFIGHYYNFFLSSSGHEVGWYLSIEDAILKNPKKINLIIFDTTNIPVSQLESLTTNIRNQFEVPIIFFVSDMPESHLREILTYCNDYLDRSESEEIILNRINLQHRVATHQKLLSRMIPRDLTKMLNKEDPADLETGDFCERELSILFMDIRSFMTMSRNLSSEDVFRFLNAYLTQIAPVIRKHGGTVDKYIGDGIMAFFRSPDQALASAREVLHDTLPDYNRARVDRGRVTIDIGIALHIGSVGVGALGESERFDISIVGENVNIASRLEEFTKTIGILLVSGDFYNSLSNKEGLSFAGTVTIRGIEDRKVPVYVNSQEMEEKSCKQKSMAE